MNTRMPKGARTFLAIAVVWLGLWAMGSALLFRGARSHDGQGPQWAMPATGIVRGADVRFEGVVDGRDPVRAPLSQRPCAGALTRVYYGTWYYDSLHKREQHAARIATQGFAELPARLTVPAADVASARASARGDFTRFPADEWLLTGGGSACSSSVTRRRAAGGWYSPPIAGSGGSTSIAARRPRA